MAAAAAVVEEVPGLCDGRFELNVASFKTTHADRDDRLTLIEMSGSFLDVFHGAGGDTGDSNVCPFRFCDVCRAWCRHTAFKMKS